MGGRWLTRAVSAVALTGAVAGAVVLGVTGSPALAQADPIQINPGNVPTTAEEFETHECDGPLAGLPENQDGWHFVLPAASGEAFTSLTLTYETPGGEVVVVIDSIDENAPSTGEGWSGFLDGMHGWLVTDAGWTLTGGEATIQNPDNQGFFNLSHTCPGKPTPTPSPTPTPTPTPSPSVSPTPSLSPTPGQTTSPPAPAPSVTPGLPTTGGRVGGAVLLGLGLVGAGGVLLMVLRRRLA